MREILTNINYLFRGWYNLTNINGVLQSEEKVRINGAWFLYNGDIGTALDKNWKDFKGDDFNQ